MEERKGLCPFWWHLPLPPPQHLGKAAIRLLVCSSQLANHINTSFNHLVYDPKGSFEEDERFDGDDWDDPDELDWKWIDVDFLDGQNSKDRAAAPAVSARVSPTGNTVRAGSSCDELSSNTRSR